MKKMMKIMLSVCMALITLIFAMPFAGTETFAKTAENEYVYFGSYPQSMVTDTSLISALEKQKLDWKSYGYYSGTGSAGSMTAGDWMKYSDVTYNGEKYRAVSFSQYRPFMTWYTSSWRTQDDNKFYIKNTYWFKYMPLKWLILDKGSGLVLSEYIVDSQAYSNTFYNCSNGYCNDATGTTYANDYYTSSIRKWLNKDFYDTAFNNSEKLNILTTYLDNSAPYYKEYNSKYSNDKVFLLSYSDTINTNYGFNFNYHYSDISRRASGTDYAKCQGLDGGSIDYKTNENNASSAWLLRSAGDYSDTACVIDLSGYGNYYCVVSTTDSGIRPALRINLTSEFTKLHVGKTLDLSGKETDEMATWSSSDESIAKVSDNGIVSAIKKGTATITATTSSGKVTVNLSVCDNSSCEWKITKAGSDTQNGERSYVCSSCEATVASEQFKDNLRVTINNSNLSYIQGEKIILAVSDFKNTKEIKPENLSVKVSDSSIIKVTGIKDFSKMNDLKIELLNNCKVVILETKDVGSASISITNSETGHTRKIPIVVSQDKYENIRADKIKTYEYKCLFEKDKYNAAFDGLWISDFSCNEVNGGWNFSMNIYNENYSNAVLEVFNKEGKLINVRIIDKFESLTKGLWKTAVAGWTVIEDIKDGDTLSFRADTTAKHTRIENLDIPQDGFIRVTADSSISVNCALVNAFDIAFTCWTFVSDVNQFISGISKFDRDSAKALTKTALTKLMAQEEYLNFAKKFQDKFIEKLGYNLSLDMLINLSNSILTDANVLLFEGLNVDFNDIVNMAFGTGVSVAEGLFLKLSGPFGVALKSIFISQDISDWVLEVNNAYKRISGKTPVGWMTPYKGTSSVLVLKNEDVTVNTNGNVPNETIMQSFRIARGNQYERAFLKIIDRPIEDYETYEIALYNDGSVVQPNGKVEVSIASPYRTATVYRQKADGSWEYIESRIKNGMVVFEVDHFCKFIVAKEKAQEQPDDPYATCNHICHKGGISAFFYKIARFFWKLFKTNKYCSCGAAHY